MRSHPATGWFIAFVVTVLYAAAGLRMEDPVTATRRTRAWQPQDAGFSLRVPRGWNDWGESRRDGAVALVRDPSDPLAGVLTFRIEPDLSAGEDGSWFDEHARSSAVREVRRVAKGELGGKPALRLEWATATTTDGERMCGYELVCDRGAARLVVEARARERDWDAVRADAAEMLASVQFEPR